MAAAVTDADRRGGGCPVVIVGHGLALSIHLGDRLGTDFDPESFWSRLAFPDAWALDDDVLHRSLRGSDGKRARSRAVSPGGVVLVDGVLEFLEVLLGPAAARGPSRW